MIHVMIAPISPDLSFQLAHGPGPLAPLWNGAPTWLDGIIAALIVVAGLIAKIKPLWSALASAGRFLLRRVKPADRDEAHRVEQRRLFARHVESQLDQLAGKEDWRDERFTELEAEVEVEGRERILRWLRHSPSRAVTLRREHSLSVALGRSAESLIILEGEPGSGKSVALRHLAHKLARKARRSHSAASRIPLYVNFKEFKPARRPVDAEAVREFILASLNRANDRDVDRFLDEEFDRGLREGTWLLLLDSFDEIPDVLSATEATGAVEEYAQAIYDFLHGMKTTRAVVASREFRGPKTFRAPRFTVMQLSARQQRDLVKRSGLRPERADEVHAGLATADPDMQQMAKNPMFLGLICEYVRTVGDFPDSAHSAYESYLDQRLKADQDRIQKRHGVGPDVVRRIAEEAAFSMAAVSGLGLTPGRRQLHSSLAISVPISVTQFDKVLDALEYTKLGRSPDEASSDPDRRFTFAHRRFQEYFATCVVLREPGRVPAGELLTNGQWRETAVTILQTQPPVVTVPLMEKAAQLTDAMAAEFPEIGASREFSWPTGCLHMLQLIDAGLGRSPERIPMRVREDAGRILRVAWERGRRHDRKWAAGVALAADRDTTLWLIEQAFASGSVLLGGIGYSVVSRMNEPPSNLYDGVRRTFTDMVASGQLTEERVALKAQIKRLPNPKELLWALGLLAGARKVLVVIAVIIAIADCFQFWPFVMPDAAVFMITFRYFPEFFSRSIMRMNNLLFEGFIVLAILLHFSVAISLGNSLATVWGWRLAVPIPVMLFLLYAVWPPTVRIVCLTRASYLLTRILAASSIFIACIALFPIMVIVMPCYLLWKFAMDWRESSSRKAMVRGVLESAVPVFLAMMALWCAEYFKLIPIFDVLFLIFILAAFSVGLGNVIRYCRNWFFDRSLVRSFSLSSGMADASELLQALHDARTPRGTNKLLEISCGRDAVGVPDTIRVLSDLGAVIETRRDNEGALVPGLGPRVEEWLSDNPATVDRVVRNASEAALDRIAQVVEQAERTRQVPFDPDF